MGNLIKPIRKLRTKVNSAIGIASVEDVKKLKAQVAAKSGPSVMPLADDEAVMRAKRRASALTTSRTGRASTILSDDLLGG